MDSDNYEFVMTIKQPFKLLIVSFGNKLLIVNNRSIEIKIEYK